MEIDRLLSDISSNFDKEKVDLLFELLMDSWLYFFFLERPGKDTRPGEDNIEVLLTVDKNNPIDIPTVKNDDGWVGVLYTSSELAQRLAEFNCKIGKMKGKKALDMFLDIEKIDNIAIQGKDANILGNKVAITEYLERFA